MNPVALETKKKNMKRILQYIVDHDGATRINIAQQLGLSVGTVTNNINDLMELGLVSMGDKISGNLGRKATVLEFAGEGKYIVVVSMYIQYLLITVVDFNGCTIRETQKYQFGSSGCEEGEAIRQEFTDIISGYIDDLEEELRRRIEYMAIAVTGLVSRDDKVYASWYRWYNIPILDGLKERYHFRIYGDNVTRFKACQEFSMVGEDMKNVIYLYIGVGVACVQFFDGKVIEGKNRAGGEIGHICLDPCGERCHCGNIGCVERFCGENYILEDAKRFLQGKDKCVILKHLITELGMPLTVETLLKAEELGSTKVHSLFMRTAQYIGKTLAIIFNIFDPDCVILSGKLVEKSDFVYEKALQEMKANIVNTSGREICVKQAMLREEDLVGAIFRYTLKRYIKELDFEEFSARNRFVEDEDIDDGKD